MQTSSNTPRVTIGIPVYNGEEYLASTLDTVLQQTYSDFTIIIADNASTDRTQEICADYAERDARIQYIRNPENVGASGNYTKCFEPAKTEFFRWQNADDPIEPTLLERCVKALDKNPDAVLSYGKTKLIDEHGNFLEDYEDDLDLRQEEPYERYLSCQKNIRLQNLMYGLIRREPLAKTALLANYIAADGVLICELSLYGKFVEVPEHLFNRRIHPEALSQNPEDEDLQKSFWDPSKKKLVMQTWRTIYERFKSIVRAPIPHSQKWKLSVHVLKIVNRRRKELANELLAYLRYGLMKPKS